LLAVLVLLASATAAHAQAGTALPDPSGLTLFALGVAGVIVGRNIAARKKDEDE
jgi:hypothetical protein